jgi:hypothetical protein
MWAGTPSGALESSRSRCRATAGSAAGTSTISALRGPGGTPTAGYGASSADAAQAATWLREV